MGKSLYTPEEFIKKYEELAALPYFENLAADDQPYFARATYMMYLGRMDDALRVTDSMDYVNGLESKESIYTYFGRWEAAYDCRTRLDWIRDSVQSVVQAEDVAAMDAEMNNAQLRVRAQQLAERNHIIISLSVMALVVLAGGFLFYRTYERQRETQRQKDYLEAEVRRQVEEIEHKNRDITDSINYAQRIQNAILPNLSEYVGNYVEGAFTFFLPCNVVSGDFYWANRKGDVLLLACADCTGHGVPGAFMSMIGTTILNEVCAARQDLSPAEVLEAVDEELIKVLNQNASSGVQDGMDVSFVAYDFRRRVVRVAAARRPVYLFIGGALTEVKGTKRSIGDRDAVCRQNAFEEHEFKVMPGDTIYICSDGIADQFGGQAEFGKRGKRLKNTGFKEMLSQINPLPIARQQAAIETLFQQWRGTCHQVDDVSLLGVRF